MANANPAPAPPVKVAVYHNRDAPFMAYDGTQELFQVASHRVPVPYSDPVAVADWALHAFSTDLERLHAGRHRPGGELRFLAACVYRLRHHRPLSVGDVVEVHVATGHYWLARDRWGWSSINPPRHLCKHHRSAATDPRRQALLPTPSSPRPAEPNDRPPATGVGSSSMPSRWG